MPAPRRRVTLFRRLLVAALALWLPIASGQGGRATCVAAASLAKSLIASSSRPHLSCHGENGVDSKKDCCCKSKTTLRAAACGCHDGDPLYATAAHDPMLGSWMSSTAPLRAAYAHRNPYQDAMLGRGTDGPDPRPPRFFFSDHA